MKKHKSTFKQWLAGFLSLLLLTPFLIYGQENFLNAHQCYDKQLVYDIATDDLDNIFMTGFELDKPWFKGEEMPEEGQNLFVTKYTSSLKTVWSKKIKSGSGAISKALALDDKGNAFVAIEYSDKIKIDGKSIRAAHDNEILIAKYGVDGQLMWTQKMTGAGIDYVTDLETDPYGNVYVSGAFQETVDADGTIYQADGEQDGFLAKFDPEGKLSWMKHFTGPKNVAAYNVAVSNSNVGVTGVFIDKMKIEGQQHEGEGDFDIWLAHFDQQGSMIWTRKAGGSYDDISSGLAYDASDNLILSGSFKLNINFTETAFTSVNDADIFIAKYNENDGGLAWARQGTGGARDDWASDITVDDEDDIILVGGYHESIVFDDNAMEGPNGVNIFAAKINSGGEVTSLSHLGRSAPGVLHNEVYLSGNEFYAIGNQLEFIPDSPEVLIKSCLWKGNGIQ